MSVAGYYLLMLFYTLAGTTHIWQMIFSFQHKQYFRFGLFTMFLVSTIDFMFDLIFNYV